MSAPSPRQTGLQQAASHRKYKSRKWDKDSTDYSQWKHTPRDLMDDNYYAIDLTYFCQLRLVKMPILTPCMPYFPIND